MKHVQFIFIKSIWIISSAIRQPDTINTTFNSYSCSSQRYILVHMRKKTNQWTIEILSRNISFNVLRYILVICVKICAIIRFEIYRCWGLKTSTYNSFFIFIYEKKLQIICSNKGIRTTTTYCPSPIYVLQKFIKS